MSGAAVGDEQDAVRLAVVCIYVPGKIGAGKKKSSEAAAASSSPVDDDPSSPSSLLPEAYLYYIECGDGLDLDALAQQTTQSPPMPAFLASGQQHQPVFVSPEEARAFLAAEEREGGGDGDNASSTPPSPPPPPPPRPTLIIPRTWNLAFDAYADAVLPDPAGGGGGWRSALLAVRGGFSPDARRSLFPNAVAAVAQGRSAHNLRHARDLAEFLADARPQVLREHAANLVRVALSGGGGGGGASEGAGAAAAALADDHGAPLPPQWCLAQLRRKWGDAALKRHGVDVSYVIRLGEEMHAAR